MGAVFPNGIKQFTTKEDGVDFIDASDVNSIQDEIVAIEQTLGSMITDVSEVESDLNVSTTEQTVLEQADVTFRTKFNTLSDRITYVSQGQNIYAAEAWAQNVNMPPVSQSNAKPTGIALGTPSSIHDPRNMFNGYGFTLRQSGFWILLGHVQIDLKGNSGDYGVYESTIGVGPNWTSALDRQFVGSGTSWGNVFLNPLFIGWLSRGTLVSLRASQTSSNTLTLRTGHLSVAMLRQASSS